MAHLLRGMAHLLALLARHAQRAPEETGESEGWLPAHSDSVSLLIAGPRGYEW